MPYQLTSPGVTRTRTFRLDDARWAALCDHAQRKGHTASDVLRHVVDAYLDDADTIAALIAQRDEARLRAERAEHALTAIRRAAQLEPTA